MKNWFNDHNSGGLGKMTIKIEVECDGLGCSFSREVEVDTDANIERFGFGIDHTTGCHYCPKCWKEVKKEMDDLEG